MITKSETAPPAVGPLGWLMFAAAALLLLGGALRSQANMISSGLLFAVIGLLSTRNVQTRPWPVKAVIVVLALAIAAVVLFF